MEMWLFMPADKAETTSSWKALGVMAMMGIACDSGEWDARMAAVAA